jgi:two-component system, sensor histidine kinase and response regulator
MGRHEPMGCEGGRESMNELSVAGLDLEEALERTGGDRELLAEVAQMCLDDIPGMLGDIRDSLSHCDAQAVRKAAHKLKGSLVALAADHASQAAHSIEVMGAEGHLDRAAEALAALEGEIEKIRPALAAIAANP